jgi:MFS family permease
VTRARISVTGVFFLSGAVFTSWYARLPAIQAELGLTPGELGVALLGAPVALLLAQPVVGAIAARRGSRTLVAAAPLYIAAVVLPALVVNAVTLLVATFIVGAASGSLDIAMNAQGVAVERAAGRRLFNSFHAAFSFGALTGAAAASLAGAAGLAPLPHLIAVAVTGAIVAGLLAPGLLRDRGIPHAPRLARPSRRLAALGIVAFCVLLAEGSVLDWSGIYLATEARARAGVAPLGLAAFSLSMGVARALGDRAADRLGPAATTAFGALAGALGLGIALAVPSPVPAIAGFALMGLGLSVVFPLTLRASGFLGDTPGPALAAVSTVGYVGFLAGPPTIGLLAEAVGLRLALLLVSGLCVVAAALAPHIREDVAGSR